MTETATVINPVHVPRVIQSHGFLLGIDLATSVVEVVSDNLAKFTGIDPIAGLGRTLGELLGPAVVDRLPVPGPSGRRDAEPRTVRLPPEPRNRSDVVNGRLVNGPRWNEFEVVAYRTQELWVLEFEPATADETGLHSLHEGFRRTLDHLRTVDGVDALCAAAAKEIRALTGYDRILVHRFHEDGHRQIVAESRNADLPSKLGLSYSPAAIAPEVLDLYLRNWLRLVADVDDEPVGLMCSPDWPAAGELDLSMASLRAASPEERRFLRDVGDAAQMTVSLVVDGRLWGLITCGHRMPRRLSQHMQTSCDVLGRVLSLQVRAAQARLDQERVSRLDGLVAEVVTAMSLADSLGDGAAQVPEALLGMVGADGAILQVEGRRITVGHCPADEDIDALVARVTSLAANTLPPWASDSLGELLERAGLGGGVGAGLAAGVLYLPFDGRNSGYTLWLRDEVVRSIRWAAEPETHPGLTPDGGVSTIDLHSSRPEHEELVRGTCEPWLPAERAAAERFANTLPAYMLHRAQRVLIEQQLAATAERLSAAVDKQQLEHQLHQHQRLESLGQLAGGVAHDFNNLLGVILSYAELVSDRVDLAERSEDGESWRDTQIDVEQIKVATRSASDLTHRLLAFARRETVQPRAFNLNHVIRGLEQLLQRTLGKGVNLSTTLAEQLPLIMADPGQIEQILVNLAVNARDAMPGGGTLSIDTSWHEPSGSTADDPNENAKRVFLEIRDTGSGIPAEVIDRIFDPFFTTKPVGEGTGLGLATVKGIVEQAGGMIEVSTAPANGTTFTLIFPATGAAATMIERRPSPVTEPVGGNATILLVEDSKDLRHVTQRLLSSAGYHVLPAANGYEAFDIADHYPAAIDLLLTDIIMPFMTGDEIADRLHDSHPQTKVLFMSGYAQPLLLADGRLRSEHVLLDKPFTRSSLLIKVMEVLGEPPSSYFDTDVADQP